MAEEKKRQTIEVFDLTEVDEKTKGTLTHLGGVGREPIKGMSHTFWQKGGIWLEDWDEPF